MKREVEIAKKLLESKGYEVSKKLRESHTVELYKSHGEDPERKRFSDYKSAKEFADSQTDNYEEIIITIPTVNGPSTINSWSKADGWYRTAESKKMNESEGLKYISNVNGYSTYRKIENGKGVWFAKRQDDPDDKMFPISYDQARGFKAMPDEKEIEKLQRKLGDILLPKNESSETDKSGSTEYYYLRDIIDTWNILDKYDIQSTESSRGIRVSKKDYDNLMKSVKNPRYLMNLIRHVRESTLIKSEEIEEGYNYSGHDVSNDLQQYLVTVVLGNTDGDGETGMTAPDYYMDLVSAIDEEDAKRQVEKGLNPGDGITDIHLATDEEVSEWEASAYYDFDDSKEMRESGKPASKESPDKFKVGDMIVGDESGNFYKIKEITPTHYICDDLQGHGTSHLLKSKVNKSFSLSESTRMGESTNKFNVGDVICDKESGIFYHINGVTGTHYSCDNLQYQGKSYLPKDKIDTSFHLLGSTQIDESTDIPHAESYKGYSIQSYDDYGATVYKNGKKIREFEDIDDAREYIDGLEESKSPLQKAILKSMNRLHESEEAEDEWKPFSKGKYKVHGSSSIGREDVSDVQNLDTDNPGEAIEAWFRISQKTPTETMIMTQTKSNAQELIDWAAENIDKIEEWYDKYDCPYEKEYLISNIRDRHEGGVKYFYESPYGFGDQIYPFCVG